ncbi:MAG: TIGR00296 family protein [Methanomassiliicoccus sp.]|nr:TIGR00296 family protein [Methanomassiliicoccus sp.]
MKDNEGEIAVRMARQAVEAEVKGEKGGRVSAPESFQEKRGVFVTISSHPEHLLRGCIGFPEPIYSLASAILRAAQHACHDPRFEDLQPGELDTNVIEVTILTPPEEIRVADRRDIPGTIVIGRDGLIAELGPYRGLLLPQVPVEWEWDAEEFLGQTCMKAGMTPDMWLDKRTRLYRFGGEIFAEESPRGPVTRKDITHGACR